MAPHWTAIRNVWKEAVGLVLGVNWRTIKLGVWRQDVLSGATERLTDLMKFHGIKLTELFIIGHLLVCWRTLDMVQ